MIKQSMGFLFLVSMALLFSCNRPESYEIDKTDPINMPASKGSVIECMDSIVDAKYLIFISIDTLRADYLGCYGNNWIQTPNIDKLAEDSIVFTDFMTVVPTTLASHTSMFTGKYPHSHGAPRNAFTVPDFNEMLAETLKANGYYTAAVISASPLKQTFNFDQGFDTFDDADLPKSADMVTERALEFLNKFSSQEKLFLFLHYWDPHKPNEISEPFFSYYQSLNVEIAEDNPRVTDRNLYSNHGTEEERHDLAKYACEVSFTDMHIGILIDELKKRGMFEESLIVLTSDHGEGHLDHPPFHGHGLHVFQEQINVPCILHFPEGCASPMRIELPAATIDLMPTLLHLLGIPAREEMEGDVVLKIINSVAGSEGPKIMFCETTRPFRKKKEHDIEAGTRWINERKRRCIRIGDYKYVFYPYMAGEDDPESQPQLFDLSKDWRERINLLEENPSKYRSLTKTMHALLMDWTHNHEGIESRMSDDMTKEDIKALKALGYL